MESLILLAASFSLNRHAVRVTKVVEERGLRVYLAVDALTLSSEQVDTFFEIESSVRSASSAEWMGLAPVVAHQIISVLGGEIKLVKKEGSDGYLEMLLLKEHLPSDTL
jgi:light-regulated signal transduction histidine kinase (bacteriophytochrome)